MFRAWALLILATCEVCLGGFSASSCGKPGGKTCFRPLKNLEASWVMAGDDVNIELAAPLSGKTWVALGFNVQNPPAMTGAYYIYCTSDNITGIGVNEGHSTHQYDPQAKPMVVNYTRMMAFSHADGQLYCSLNVSVPIPSMMPPQSKGLISLNASHSLILAYGPVSANGELEHHHDHEHSTKTINVCSAQPTSVAADKWLTPEIILALKKAHGSLMIIAWLFCMSMAILVARYFKGSFWGRSMVADKAVWFQLHRGLNGFGVLCTVAAFILIFVANRGVYTGPKVGGSNDMEFYNIHSLLGLLCSILGFVQPIGAMLRPHPGGNWRGVFNWLHRGAGVVSWLLAAATIYLATKFPYLGTQLTSKPIAQILLCVLWGSLGLAILLLEAHYWIFVRRAHENSFDLDKGSSSSTYIALDRPRSVLLLVVSLLALAVTLSLVVFIGLSHL